MNLHETIKQMLPDKEDINSTISFNLSLEAKARNQAISEMEAKIPEIAKAIEEEIRSRLNYAECENISEGYEKAYFYHISKENLEKLFTNNHNK